MKRPSPMRLTTPSLRLFFDGRLVVTAAERANRQALMRAGAFIRRRARSSIRKRKKISAPGKPPSSHTGRLKGLILFAYDRMPETVVIGPRGTGRDQAGETLEHGKTVTRRVRRRRRRMRYRARPFMGPALQKETQAGSFPKLWANAVKA